MSEDRPDPDRTDLPSTEAAPSSTDSQQIGPYRLLQKIGEGGMGEVWLAEQTEPVKRKVALKVIKQGMDTKQVVARFEAERQALAMMDHPAVAKVFDAGSTPHGRPYFVMEYVKGVPITEHCDRHKLTNRERLDLFMQVCEGVQHAHQKAIIHRDLKPSNVLVTEQDGKRLPKIIDFGVAKATAQKLTEKTLFTELGVLIGTPEYMSPEQADLTGEDVDTRTDVYSLGVILYELLVGALPFDSKELRSGGFEGIRKKIREEEPHKPSTRLSTLGDQSTESAKCRRVDLPTLQRQLRGDLDWITMKALDKERSRRYGSPTDLAADIGRYLADEPVLASPPSAAYRSRKFVRRHRFGVLAAAVGVMVLIGFAATMAVQAARIAAERDRADLEAQRSERVSRFLADMIRNLQPRAIGTTITDHLREKVAEAKRGQGKSDERIAAALASFDELLRGTNPTDTALHVLDKNILEPAAEAVEERFAEDPSSATRLRDVIAKSYEKLGLYRQAEPHARAALEGARAMLGENAPKTLKAALTLGTVLWRQGRLEEAEASFLDILERSPDPVGSTAQLYLGVIYTDQDRYEEALPLIHAVVDRCTRVRGPDHNSTLAAVNVLANLHYSLGQYSEALSLYAEVAEGARRNGALGAVCEAVGNIGNVHLYQGRLAEAEATYLEAIEVCRSDKGSEHGYTLKNRVALGSVYRRQGRAADAEKLLREVYELRLQLLGERHRDTVSTMRRLMGAVLEQGRPEEVRSLVALDLQLRKEAAVSETAGVSALNAYAWQALTCEPADLRDPRSALEFALAANEETGHENPSYLDTLALAYHLNGDSAKAIETQRRALSLLSADSSSRVGIEERLSEFEAALDKGE